MADRSVLVRLRADVSDLVAKSALAKEAIRGVNNEIDKSNDRTAWLAQGVLALVPAFTRLGAGAVPVLSGVATQLTVGVAAAGVAVLAFNGVGDALGALNDYQLKPTEENLAKLNEAMAKIGPEGQALVNFLDSISPQLSQLANSARGGMFPGVIEGIEQLLTLAPQLNVIVREIGEGLGQLTSEAGAGLSGDRFAEFFDYLETRAKPILVEMGQTIGNFTLGFANMLVAFDPLTDDFSKGLLEMSRSFAAWSEGLASSTGFQEFVAYVREAGPDALEFLGSLVSALVELAEAAAPVGAIMLPVLTGLLNVVGDLANTPLGPLTIGILSLTSAWGRLNAIMEITGSGILAKATAGMRANVVQAKAAVPTFRQLGSAMAFSMISTDALAKSSMSYSQKANQSAVSALRARGAVADFGKSAAPVAGQLGLLALAMSDVDDKMGLTNTTSLALAGSLFGGVGAAIGATAGLFLDGKAAADDLTSQIQALDAAAAGTDLSALDAQLNKAAESLRQAKADAEDLNSQTGITDIFGDFGIAAKSGSFNAHDGQEERVRLLQEAYDDAKKAREQLTEAEKKATTEAIRAQDADARRDSIVNDIEAETAALNKNIEAMREKRAEALRGLNAELDYKASLLDAADALKENGRTVDENTRGGQANLRSLYGMAAAFNAQGDAAKDSAGEVRAGRDAFVKMATAMGMGEQKARDLAKQLYELPAKVPIVIGVDAETAMAHAKAIKAELATIDRNIDIYVNVRKPNMGGFGPQIAQADGGTVPGERYPYGDKIHAMLAPGEEIITNRHGEADQYRRDRDAGRIPRYADGGTAGERKKKRKTELDFEEVVVKGPRPEDIARMLRAAEDNEHAAAVQAAAARVAALAAKDQLDAAEKGEQTAKNNLDAAKQQQDSFRDSVAGKFSNSLTGGGLAGLTQTLSRDTNASTSMDATLRALVAAGLDPTSRLYQEIANSEDQRTANELLAAGPGYIDNIESQYAARDAANAARAGTAADSAFGPLVAQQQAAYDVAVQQLAAAQAEVARADFRDQQRADQLAQLQTQVGSLAGQLADALNSTVRGGRR